MLFSGVPGFGIVLGLPSYPFSLQLLMHHVSCV